MFSNLPPNIQEWIINLNNNLTPMNIRYNYFTMLSNVADECKKEVDKFQKVLDKERK